jgi:hypothetical protein
VTAVALKLRDDAYYAETSTGTYVLLPHGEVTLEGSSVHRWIERLAPHLDGSRSLEELTAGLPEARRAFVTGLVHTLVERGIVREIALDGVGGPVTEATDRPAELSFVGYFLRTPPGPALDAYRQTAVLVAGSGFLLPRVVRALVRSGAQRVRVAVSGERATDVALLRDCSVHSARQVPPQEVEWHRLDVEGLPGLVAAAGLVVHVCGRQVPQQCLRIEAECAERGIPLAQAGLDADGIWIRQTGVPGQGDGSRTAGLASVWLRRGAMGTPAGGDQHAGGPEAAAPTPVGATVAAGLLAHDAFRYVTGTGPGAGASTLIRVSLDGGACDPHRLVAHPRTRRARPLSEEEFLSRLSKLEAGQPMAEEEFSQRAAGLADERLGIIGEVGEGDLTQLPLHVAQAVVSDPMGLLAPGQPRPVATGAGLDFTAARLRTALRALAWYGSRMVDPRRLLSPAGSTPGGRPGGGRIHAIGLTDGRAHLVPATLAFPALRAPASQAPPPGVAGAYSWRAAVEAGLIGQCRRLGVAEAVRSRDEFPRVNLDAAPLDPPGERLLAYLACTGEPLAVHDVTGTLGVPTFACSLGGGRMTYGCGRTVTEALRDGLETLLLAWQADVNNEPAYAPQTWPRIQPANGDPLRKPAERAALDLPALAGALHRNGQIPLAVPLDHDEELHARMPYLAHVVLQPCSTG